MFLHIRKSLETEILPLLRTKAAKDKTVWIGIIEIEAAIYFEPTEETPTTHLKHRLEFLNLAENAV